MKQGVLLIVGAGAHGRVVLDCAQSTGCWNDFAFVDDAMQPGAMVDGVAVLGSLSHLKSIELHRFDSAIVALGNAVARERAHGELRQLGLPLGRVIHSRAAVARTARIGAGSVVLCGAVLGPGVDVGEGVIVNCGAVIDHDAALDDFSHVSVGALVGARARVARGGAVAMGVVLAQDALA